MSLFNYISSVDYSPKESCECVYEPKLQNVSIYLESHTCWTPPTIPMYKYCVHTHTHTHTHTQTACTHAHTHAHAHTHTHTHTHIHTHTHTQTHIKLLKQIE